MWGPRAGVKRGHVLLWILPLAWVLTVCLSFVSEEQAPPRSSPSSELCEGFGVITETGNTSGSQEKGAAGVTSVTAIRLYRAWCQMLCGTQRATGNDDGAHFSFSATSPGLSNLSSLTAKLSARTF